MDEKQIKAQAKEIMDSFMEALGDIELGEGFDLERKNCFREDGDGAEVDEDFIQRFLANAPKVKGDSIVADKGAWV